MRQRFRLKDKGLTSAICGEPDGAGALVERGRWEAAEAYFMSVSFFIFLQFFVKPVYIVSIYGNIQFQSSLTTVKLPFRKRKLLYEHKSICKF